MNVDEPARPTHVAGTLKGEEMLFEHGPEPGREKGQPAHRVARDSTAIGAKGKGPIDPRMPHIPPA